MTIKNDIWREPYDVKKFDMTIKTCRMAMKMSYGDEKRRMAIKYVTIRVSYGDIQFVGWRQKVQYAEKSSIGLPYGDKKVA
jgi:hypothetical protein